jgi:hypothetical protein
MREFGIGKVICFPASGSPVEFAKLQDVKFDTTWDVKELYGQYQFPIETARAKAKMSITAAWAEIRADAMNQILDGTITSGSYAIDPDVAHTIATCATAASTAYTVSVPGGGTFYRDLQVVNVSDTTLPPVVMTQASDSVPTDANTYYTSTDGTYVFSSIDGATGLDIQITYEYSLTTGKTVTVINKLMGIAPRFGVRIYNTYNNYQFGLYFPAVIAPKLSLNMKLDDFTIPDFEMSPFADGAGNVFTAYIGHDE